MSRQFKLFLATCRQRNIECTLAENDWTNLRSQACAYCNIQPGNGIDRTDPNRGYHLDNCKPCCKRCNARKSIYEPHGTEFAVSKAQELASRNSQPPYNQRDWKRWRSGFVYTEELKGGKDEPTLCVK